MGLIKEYIDRAVQTETDPLPFPYADPAIVLAAPPLTHRRNTHEAHHNSVGELFPSESQFVPPHSPISPILAPLISRLSKRKLASETPNRRIVSMPENRSEASTIFAHCHGKRVVSMPDRVRSVLEPSAELSQSPSTATGDSFGSYSGRRERIRVFPTHSDTPQTPSPPSSPESLLIIAAGAQLSEGFLRRKYSPEPLIEEDEDWITWANSPPRPIPALHGPLSLPYARCPSGAEGTIIEEPDNVAQMIWGLGPDDQPHTQIRAEGLSSHFDNSANTALNGPSQAPPRLQKKRTPQQVHKLSRTQISTHSNHTQPSLARIQRQAHEDRHNSLSRVSSDIETQQDIVGGLLCNEGQSMPTNIGFPDNLARDPDGFSVENNHTIEWQLARLRHALRTSLVDVDSFNTYSGQLEPIIPASGASGFPQSYPRIFVEPRPNEAVGPATRKYPVELMQQYRQQQLCRQALQKQKLKVQSILPTPPNSSSPQWSSHFSPYLTYCSAFSPESVGSPEYPVSVSSQKYRSGADPSQYLRRVYEQYEHDPNDFDSNTNFLSAKTTRMAPNVNSAASSRQNLSSSTTLAKYIKQLQALSPIAHFPPFQQVPLPNVPLPPLPSADKNTIGPLQNVFHSPGVPTPPSPESPQTRWRRSSYHNAHSMPTCPMQRRLSSVPEEDSTFVGLSASVSPSSLENHAATDSRSSSHDGTTGHQIRYLEVPPIGLTRSTVVPDSAELESSLRGPFALHEASPAKVRLPVNKEHSDVREQAIEHHEQNKGHQHGHRKKHRYKKLKGPTATNEQTQTRGLVA